MNPVDFDPNNIDLDVVEALNSLPDIIEGGITDPIGQISSWLWGQIQGLVNGVKDTLSGLISGVAGAVNFIKDLFSKAGDTFKSFVQDPIGAIKGSFSYIWSITPDWIKSPLNFLANLATQVGNTMINFFKDPVGTIKGLWDVAPDWLKAPVNFLANVANQVGNAMISFFKDPVGTLKGLATTVWDMLPGWLRGTLSSLGGFLANVGTAFVNFMKDPIGSISQGLGWVADQLKGLIGGLQDAATKIGALVAMPVDALSKGISDVLSGKVFEWFSTAFSQSIGGIGQAIIDSIVKPVYDFMDKNIFEPFKDFAKGFWDLLSKGISYVANWASQNVVSPVLGGIGYIVDQIKNFISDFYSKAGDALNSLSASSPEDALASWPKKAAELTLPLMSLGALAAAASTKIAGSGLELKPITDLVARVVNPDIILNPVISGMIGAGLGIQITRAMNLKYRPKVPDARMAYELLREKLISEAEFYKYAAYEGWSQDLAQKLIKLWDYDPTIGDLITLSNYVELTDDFITQVFDINRFPDELRPYWISMIKLRPLRNEISSYIGSIVTLRNNGYITSDAFSGYMAHAYQNGWIKQKEIDLRNAQTRVGFLKNLLDVKIETLRYMFRKGTLTADQLEASLVNLGLDPLMANAIKENELARAGLLAPA